MATTDNWDSDEVCKRQEDPGRQEKMAAALLQVRTGTASLHQQKPEAAKGDDIVTARPKASAGVPDEVTFGIYAKTFLGASMKENSFDLDFVLQLTWNDPRVVGLVPAGVDEQTLSAEQATKSIWMPGIVVTNRAIKMYEIISTVVMIRKSGDVTKVERATVTCRSIFDLRQYPFDTQSFKMKIASSEYMLDELVLKPSKNQSDSGVSDGIFDAFQYELDSWKIYSFEEQDGAMTKSRGVLQIDGKRSLDKYGEAHLMPTAMVLIISFGVFWFPFQTPFVTPRMALSILALLSFTNFMIKTSEKLPPGAPTNWNDVFNYCVLVLMCAGIVINIMAEICDHQLKLPHLGAAINNEAKVLQPAHSFLLLSIVHTGGKYQWISVGSAQVLVKVLFVTITTGYIAYSIRRMSFFKAEKEAKEKEDHDRQEQAHAQAHDPRHGVNRAQTSEKIDGGKA